MTGFLKREFSSHNVWFSYPKAEAFYLPQWQWSWLLYLLYRIVLAVYTAGCLIDYVVVMSGHVDVAHNVMVYMTTWTYILLVIHFNLAAMNVVYCIWCERRSVSRVGNTPHPVKPTSIRRLTLPVGLYDEKADPNVYFQGKSEADLEADMTSEFNMNADRSTWYMKLSWLVFSVVFNWSIIVTLVFFGAIYPTFGEEAIKNGISFEDVNIHALNTAFVIMEVLFSAYPVRFYHFLYSVLYGLMYMIFNITYWSYDPVNHIVYVGILDWNYPWSSMALALVLAFIVTPILQLIHLVLYKLRCFIYRKVYGHEYLFHQRVSCMKKTVSTDSNANTKEIAGLPRDDSTAPMISTVMPLAVEGSRT